MQIGFIDSALMIDDALMHDHKYVGMIFTIHPKRCKPYTRLFSLMSSPNASNAQSLPHSKPPLSSSPHNQISLLSPPPSVALPSTAQSLLNATVSVAA